MRDPLNRADYYRKEAVRCHDLAKYAQPAFLGDFYRRIAVRYMFMAEELLKEARARGDVSVRSDHSSRRRVAGQHHVTVSRPPSPDRSRWSIPM
jgi:hypothetical protein